MDAIDSNSNSLFLAIGPGYFLVHHAIALGLHPTTLILVKGALDAHGSKLRVLILREIKYTDRSTISTLNISATREVQVSRYESRGAIPGPGYLFG